ncbi:SAM-dependent methyltransferase [Salininema proteolyticum]|uniref:SAM-dependent methyltransferase n=1 Tax=Salininema proteolyticum TaxID=1607685 RepID=A0ABV8U3R9_9ACTN
MDEPIAYAHLTYNSPIAPWRAERLIARLAARRPARILDLGCGWGSLLLGVLAASPEAGAVGVDLDGDLLRRARKAAEAEGLTARVEFAERDASTWDEPADLVLCVGASHIWGDSGSAVRALRPLVKPGGFLLFGDMVWERTPTDADLSRLWEGASRDELPTLAALSESVVDAGFRPLGIETVERGEMDDFESGFLADWEEFLLRHPDSPKAEHYRRMADEHRRTWLEGHRNLAGFAYLVAGRPHER